MSNITEIFERTNIQQIRAFLQSGSYDNFIKTESYQQRIDNARQPVNDFLQNLKSSEVEDIISRAMIAYEDVYMEIGLQCGFMLAMEIYTKNE